MPADTPRPIPPELQLQTVGPARVLVLNRPERRNALTPDLAAGVARAVADAGDDEAVRAVVLRGAGGHFCVGLDLKWFMDLADDPRDPGTLEEGLRAFQEVVRAIVRSPLPVVAALEGSVAGFGFDMALACDLRVAAASATFRSAFAPLGLVPDGGSTVTLPRLVGPERAARILLADETLDAEAAREVGLVGEVVPTHQLDAAVERLADRLAGAEPGAARRIETLLRAGEREVLDAQLEREGRAQLEALRSPAFRRRLAEFIARRGTGRTRRGREDAPGA